MLETILLWFFVVVVGCWTLGFIIVSAINRFERLKAKRARRLLKEIVQFYAASYVKGRITKDDFFQQSRRLLIGCKYHQLSESGADRCIEVYTGFTSD